MSERDTEPLRPVVRLAMVEVCCLPETHPAYPSFVLEVRYGGHDRWKIQRPGRGVWSRSKEVFESEASDDRTDREWLADHRFGFGEAQRLACTIAPLLKVMGHTIAEAFEKEDDW
jgi:hypothetical protein